jgi:maltokinase
VSSVPGSLPGASAAAVRRLVPSHIGPGIERQVSTDQANVSIAVDERWLVKWFTRPIAHRDLAVVDQLSSMGFVHMPTYAGAVIDAPDDDGGQDGEAAEVVAVVSEFVPGATDGWQWYVDDVLAWIDGDLAIDAPDGPVATAARMGSIAADLHEALAAAGVERAPLAPIRAAVAERRRQAVEHTTGDVGARLSARLGRIDAALSALDGIDTVMVQRVHGDLHAGQFIRSGDRLLVIDFDGDPMTSSADRLERQPVERDVAALLQSIDHVARVASKRRPGSDVSMFVDLAIDAAERSYRDRHPVDDRLLWPLRVAQELHEYAYAALHLPVWTYVPDSAMQALFPAHDQTGGSDV